MSNAHHFCSIYENQSFSGIPKLPPGASCFKRLKRRLRKCILLSSKHPVTKRFFRSRAAILAEKRFQVRSKYWYIIHPYSEFSKSWNCLYTISLIAGLIIFPLHSAYQPWEPDLLHHIFHPLLFFINAIFILDILKVSLTAYYNPITKVLVLDPKKIIWHYLKSTFAADLISALPIYEYYKDFKSDYANPNWEYLQFHSFFRIWRIRDVHKSIMMQNWDQIWKSLLWFLFCIFIALHWTACWYTICLNTICTYPTYGAHESKLAQGGTSLTNYMHTLFLTSCLYLHVNDDIVLKTGISRPCSQVLDTIIAIMGNVSTGAAMVEIMCITNLFFISESKFERILNHLENYMNTKKLPDYDQDRIRLFFNHKFKRRYFRESAILATLSTNLQTEIKYHTATRLIQRCPMFKSVPKSELLGIIRYFKPIIYLPTDVLIESGSYNDRVLFINKGVVIMKSPIEKDLFRLCDGAFLGSLALLNKFGFQAFPYSVVAETIVEAFSMGHRQFSNVVMGSPVLAQRFQDYMVHFFHTRQEMWDLHPTGDHNV